MADLVLDDQPTLTQAELAECIIAVQSRDPKVWLKVTPAELLTLLSVGNNAQGQLIATCSIPVGSHDHVTVFEWTVETGVTIVSVIELYATAVGNRNPVTNGALEVPLTRQGRTTQIGWFVEITNGDTIVYERLFPFNDYVFAPPPVEAQAQTTVTTDGLQIRHRIHISLTGIRNCISASFCCVKLPKARHIVAYSHRCRQ